MTGVRKKINDYIKSLYPRTVLAEHEIKFILKNYGVPTTDFRIISDIEQVKSLNLKFPVAVKVSSAEILHKSDVGGVVLNVDREDLKVVVNRMLKKFHSKPILVEPMCKGNVELIVGLLNDATFGLTIMTGIGGIFTELYKDVCFRILPINRYDADSMLKELKGAKLLEGFRGLKVDRNAIIDILLKMSAFGVDFEEYIDQLDLNPVMVMQDGAVVVDAKLILKPS